MPEHASHAATLLAGDGTQVPRVLYLLAVLVVLGLAWTHLASVEVFVRAPGIVRPDGEVLRITAEAGGRVEAIRAREGDTVARGQILIELDSTPQRSESAVIGQGIDARKARLLDIDRRIQRLENLYDAERRKLDTQVRAARKALSRAESAFQVRLATAALRLREARRHYRDATALFDAGLVSHNEWNTRATEVALARIELRQAEAESADRSDLDVLEESRRVAAMRFAADRADLDATRNPIETELNELRFRLDGSRREEEKLTIRSPARGRLALVERIHPGEHLEPGAVVATLEPARQRRVVEAILANDQARRVRRAQPAILWLGDSVRMEGHVRSVSPDVRFDETGAGGYRVIIDPDDAALPLGLGMEVHFVTETRSILSLLTRRISDSFSELGG